MSAPVKRPEAVRNLVELFMSMLQGLPLDQQALVRVDLLCGSQDDETRTLLRCAYCGLLGCQKCVAQYREEITRLKRERSEALRTCRELLKSIEWLNDQLQAVIGPESAAVQEINRFTEERDDLAKGIAAKPFPTDGGWCYYCAAPGSTIHGDGNITDTTKHTEKCPYRLAVQLVGVGS